MDSRNQVALRASDTGNWLPEAIPVDPSETNIQLSSRVHADAAMDRIVHNTIWIDTGTHNMREHAAASQ